jgi:hypothetical protein
VNDLDDDELRRPQFTKPPLSTGSVIAHAIVAGILVLLLLAGLGMVAFAILMVLSLSSYGSSK